MITQPSTSLFTAIAAISLRPPRREDAEAIHRLLVEIEKADQRGWLDSLEEVQRYFDDPTCNVETDALLVWTSQRQLAALGFVFSFPPGESETIAFPWGEVHPDQRGRGLGHAMLTWLEARAQQILADQPADKPRILRVNIPETQPNRIALFEAHGFQHVRSAYRMRRDLRAPIPEAPLPAGLTFQTWRADLDLPMLAAFNETFRDHWGFTPVDQTTWKMWFSGHPNFRPDLTLLVMEGDQIAAFSFNEVRQPEIDLTGVHEAWIRDLGTRRPWRGRGLATALLCQSMRLFKTAAGKDRQGYDYAGLGVDTENLSGALRIYERVGFKAIRKNFTYSKTVR